MASFQIHHLLLMGFWAVFVEFWFFVDSSFTIPLESFPISSSVIEQQQAGELKEKLL